jgi:hypothetical protein
MANSKNTKKDRDEKKAGDLSALNENYPSNGTAANSDSETAGSEFTSKSSSSFDEEEENDHRISAYASKINKSYGESSDKSPSQKNEKEEEKEEDDYSYTSQLGNDQRSEQSGKQFSSRNNPYRGSSHQLSYDQQFRYQQRQPSSSQQYGQSYNKPFDQSYGNQGYQSGSQQRFSNQRQGFVNQNQSYRSSQEYPNSFSQQNFQGPGYDRSTYGPSYDQPQGYNQAYNYGNQFGNQQFVNRGYENHNYNDQSNRLRSSFNTQGFGDSIYRHENYHPEAGGSGYAGSTFGGQGSGEFRSNEFEHNQPYGNPSFPTHRQEFRNPSRGYTRNYRQDEQRRNEYQNDEDGILGFQNEYDRHFESGYHTPYGNEREEQYRNERESSRYGRPRNDSNRNFENREQGRDFERNYSSYERSNRKNRNRRNSQ